MMSSFKWQHAAITATVAGVGIAAYLVLTGEPDEEYYQKRDKRIRDRKVKRAATRRISRRGLTLDQTKKLCADTKKALTATMTEVAAKEKQIRKNCQARGQQIGDQELRQYLMSEMMKTQKAKEEKIHKAIGCTEKIAHQATEKHSENEEIKAFVEWTKQQFAAISGEDPNPPDIPSDLSPSKVLQMLEEINDISCDTLKIMFNSLKQKHNLASMDEIKEKLKTDPMFCQEFQQAIQKAQQHAQEKVMKEHSVTDPRAFAAAVKGYATDQAFAQKLNEANASAQRRMQELMG